MRRLVAPVVALLLLCIPALAGAVGTTVDKVRMSVRIVPQPVVSNGKVQAVYEVHLENNGDKPLLPRRLAVLHEGTDSTPVVVYEGDALLANMDFYDHGYRKAGREYLRDASEDPHSIGPGMIGVVYVWLPLDAPIRYPSNWYHQVTLAVASADAGSEARDAPREISFSGARFTLAARPPVRIGPPLEGGPWWVMETMDNGAVHRRAMVLGMPFVSQRFGADYLMLGDSGTAYKGSDISNIDNWYGYGQNVLAVADGVIVDVNDGLPNNVPGSYKTVVELSADNINGNYVVLDIGGGQYAAYAHLAPGSVRVSLGQVVKKGVVIGRLGNSGNSPVAPHLHFHIGSSNHIFAAEGLPFAYDSFKSLGVVSMQQLQTGGFKPGDVAAVIHRDEIPAHDSVIVFPVGGKTR